MSDSHSATSSRVATGASADNSSSGKARVLPIHILDVGKAKSGDVKDLKKGRGKLLDEVADTIVELEASVAESAVGQNVVPVIVVVERKRKQKMRL